MSLETVTGSDFKYPIRFENQIKTSNISAGQTETAAPFVNVRGLPVKVSGVNDLQNGANLLINVYDFYTYWRSNLEAFINKDTRIIYDNRIYRIETYERMTEDRRYFHFTTSEAH